jgi:hypothetical protein
MHGTTIKKNYLGKFNVIFVVAMFNFLYLKHIACSLYMRNSRFKCLENVTNEFRLSYLKIMCVVALHKATQFWNKIEPVLSLKYKNR